MIDIIVLAGGAPVPESSLYPYTQGRSKAALDIGGKPMLQWVLDALEEAVTVNGIVVVGSKELQNELHSTKIISFKPSGTDMIHTFKIGADAVLESNPAAERVAVLSADVPLISPESVDWVINKSLEDNTQLYYFVIMQTTMEEKYPESARSYTRLKDMSVCGGDIAVISLDLYTKKEGFWSKISRARKSSLRQAALIGIDILILLLLRRLTLDDVVNRVTQRLNITAKGLVCPYAEIGMDIDKPHQLEMVRNIITRKRDNDN